MTDNNNEEVLVNFKNVMHQWYPLTTEMNSAINAIDTRIDDVAEEIYMKTGCTNQLRDTVDIVDLETEVQNMLVNLGLTYEGWLSDNGVEECIVSVGQSLGYDDDTVFIVLDHFYFYDSSEEKVSLINDYNVKLEASSYNVNIDGSVTLTATLIDKVGNPIPYQPVTLYRNGSSLNSGITNANGVVTFTTTCTSWGIIDFSVNNVHCQVDVTGWRWIHNEEKWQIGRNATHGMLVLKGWSSNAPTSWKQFGGQGYAYDFRPIVNTYQQNDRAIWIVNASDGTISFKSTTGSAINTTAWYGQIEWAISQ